MAEGPLNIGDESCDEIDRLICNDWMTPGTPVTVGACDMPTAELSGIAKSRESKNRVMVVGKLALAF